MADRGASGPRFCGALCKGVIQRLPAGGLGRCKPQEANAFSQQLLKIG